MIFWVAERRVSPVRAGWQAVAEQVEPPGGFAQWDVFALHDSGARVPAGPNRHAKPDAEMDRLHRVIECTRSGCPLGCPAFP